MKSSVLLVSSVTDLSWPGQLNREPESAATLVMLSLYVFIPPSRGLEIRTLEIVNEGEGFDRRQYKDRNVLLIKEDGIVLYINNYKTKRSSGRDELSLQREDELSRILLEYIKTFRRHLTKEGSGKYLLLNKNGDKFTCAAFSSYLKRVFYGLTGKMKHSKTYDKRTANQRKELAVTLARDYAEEEFEDGAEQGPIHPPDNCVFKPGDFVGCIEESSTLNSPKVLIGQVHSLRGNGDVSLLWHRKIAAGLYSLELDGEEWLEAKESLTAVSLRAARIVQACTVSELLLDRFTKRSLNIR
ncbi:hypothetical protein OS493_031746 [Desmophyllum pertusum]|uniref:Uncharacterized protein n=1 Tax=Desmophyllum pertusum TaxID=174260 RepID=A0A9W9ZL60_9CNID|nr:hypothetical protein OS493_031746 [Desmophyllum pertusum]